MAQTEQKTALIIGASRGLGLGLSLELARRGWHVTATRRAAGGGLDEHGGELTIETLDIDKPATVAPFVARMQGKVFDVVFINAGVGGPEGKTAANVTPEEIAVLMMTNAVSPVRLAEQLVPMVKPRSGILAFMSSILGSVALAKGGFATLYSASKAALNSLTKSFVGELPEQNFTVLTLHPGWVKTDMGGPQAEIDIATSVTGLADVLAQQGGSGGHKFLNYRGETLPW